MMIVVPHSTSLIEGLADFLLYMEAGTAAEYGETEQLLREPRDAPTREFLSHAR